MARNRALDLIQRLATDGEFRNRLNGLDAAGKRALLDASGFAGVNAEDIRSVAGNAPRTPAVTDEAAEPGFVSESTSAITTVAASRPVSEVGESTAAITTIFAAQPVTDATIFAAQPVADATIFAAQPVTDSTIFAAQPVTDATIFAAQPVTDATIFAAQPATGATIFAAQPVREERPHLRRIAARNGLVGTAHSVAEGQAARQ